MNNTHPEPHGHRLRTNRYSESGRSYSVTMCCADKERLFDSAAVRTTVAQTIEEAVDFGVDILDAYVVMPDHLHILFKLGHDKTLERTVNDLKKIIARRTNDMLGRRGAVWQRGYYEHAIRGADDHERYVKYIETNPVRRGLVRPGEEYAWCRAHPTTRDSRGDDG